MEELFLKSKLIKSLMVTLLLGLPIFINADDVKGKIPDDKQLEFIKGDEYIPLEEAINQFENRHEKKVSLPKKLPFDPTHRFGHINNVGHLKLHYMKIDKKPTLDFIFFIMPEKEIEKHFSSNDKVYKIENGVVAYYKKHHRDFQTLTFKRNGFGYLLGGHSTDNIDLDELIEIAESIK
jgi:hypothetical protein